MTPSTPATGQPVDLRKVTITMPQPMLEELRDRAKERSISVTELIRRAVALAKFLTEDPDTELFLRRPGSDRETLLKVL
jgi:hypothetical protein